jgi:N-acetylneuraminate synthase
MSKQHVYIIAEAGVNHNGSLDLAKSMIDCAADAGADAVKFQSFNADKLVAKSAKAAEYQKAGLGTETSQWQMLKDLEISESMHLELVKHAAARKIDFLSTPFDSDSLKMLVEKTGIKHVKVASGEVTNAPLLLDAARTKLPVILSTGMCTLGEVEDALGVLAYGYLTGAARPSDEHCFRKAFSQVEGQNVLRENVTLLQCTSEYPTRYEDVNLRAMSTLASSFSLPVGLSDHTPGIEVSVAAVALGATVIEKHFTLDRKLVGPDHQVSLEPGELKALVSSIRHIEVALGSPIKKPTEGEVVIRALVRKGLTASANIKEGERFTEKNVTMKRPEGVLSAFNYWNVVGRPASRAYAEDEALEEMVVSK